LSLVCLYSSVQVVRQGLPIVDVDPGLFAGQDVVQHGAGLARVVRLQRRMVLQRPWRRW
jgi:hypothetical protein